MQIYYLVLAKAKTIEYLYCAVISHLKNYLAVDNALHMISFHNCIITSQLFVTVFITVRFLTYNTSRQDNQVTPFTTPESSTRNLDKKRRLYKEPISSGASKQICRGLFHNRDDTDNTLKRHVSILEPKTESPN